MSVARRYWAVSAGCLSLGLMMPVRNAGAQINQFVSMTPFQTFYRTDATDAPRAAAMVDLSSIAAGTMLRLTPAGTFSFCGTCGPAGGVPFAAVFSSTNELLASSIQNRVPGAVAPGAGATGFVSPVTLFDHLATDIPFDFFIGNATVNVAKPSGANFLFIGVIDSYYGDNSTTTPDAFGVNVLAASTTAPEPSALVLMSTGLVSLGGVSLRRRRRAA
jgi:hypothetical protein